MIIKPKMSIHENMPIISLMRSDISRFMIASIVNITNCPPSKIGRGSRFIMPKLILMIAKKIKSDLRPFWAIFVLDVKVMIGPAKPSVLFVATRFFKLLKIAAI